MGSGVREAERRSLFHPIHIKHISVPALNTCARMLIDGDEQAKALLLLALLDMHQSKPMRLNMKEPEELEPMWKIDEGDSRTKNRGSLMNPMNTVDRSEKSHTVTFPES